MGAIRLVAALLWALWTAGGLLAQDEAVISYFQSPAFNVPIPEGWENQSSERIAQFYLADAQASIRAAVVDADNAVSAVEQDLRAWLGSQVEAPLYQGKVNLADGTWAVLVYQIDADTTASVMARGDEASTIVISFVEDHPEARIVMAAIAQSDDAAGDASAEMAAFAETFSAASRDDLREPQTVTLPSGEWLLQSSGTVSVTGWVFGNDSYLGFAEGAVDNLPELASAYHSSLLGFFVTPDNSDFLLLGLAAVFGTLGILLFSFVWRGRDLQKEHAMIQELARADD